jgi:UPF0755 protein
MMKRLALGCLTVIIMIAAAGYGAWHEMQFLMTPISPPTSAEPAPIIIDIPRGSSASEIGRMLEDNGVIRSGQVFRLLTAYQRVGGRLKAGEHVLHASLSTPEVIDSLIQGRFKMYPLTIPEGLTMKEIARLAAEAGLADEQEFLKLCRNREFISSVGLDENTLEGYLFPETYHFSRNTTTEDVVRVMVGRFWTVWEKYKDAAEKNELTRHEIVTLASIIEKETGAAPERPLIASVFLNRLKKGMRLETDPTVIYGVKDFDGNLTRKHLQTPTPYNTYLIAGLPPGPIASPGEASLRAVFEPVDADYYFFVSKNDGTHQFSKTLAEHNQAVNKYQRRRSQ